MSSSSAVNSVKMPANRSHIEPDSGSPKSAAATTAPAPASSSKAKKSRAKRDAQKAQATKVARQAAEIGAASAAEVLGDDLLSRLQIAGTEESGKAPEANGPQTNGHESPPSPQSSIAIATVEPELALVPPSTTTNTSPITSNTTTTTTTTITKPAAEAENAAGDVEKPAALTADSISYVIYQNELQMPDIMRLIQKDLSEPYSIYTYRYFIHNWPKLCYLAMHGDQCVGAIVCKLDVHRQVIKRGYIAMLAVDKEYRKLKIGTKLVQNAIQSMLTYHADEVVLETEITNTPALRLYENLGFVRDKRLFGYYLNGVDALRLKLWFR